MGTKKKNKLSETELKLVEDIKPRTRLPNLTWKEQADLKDYMLKMALELERSKRYTAEIEHTQLKNSLARMEFKKHERKLEAWNVRFSKKLKKYGLSSDLVDVDAESGEVKPSVAYLAAQKMAAEKMETDK